MLTSRHTWFTNRKKRRLTTGAAFQEQIDIMDDAAARFLTNDARRASWLRWKSEIMLASRDAAVSRRAFYILKTIGLLSAITVPSLVGLNLAGTGGRVVRWLTFAFSLIAAILTSILTLYRIGDRWLMHKKLRDDLMAIGWTLIQSPGGEEHEEQQAWRTFITETELAISEYGKTYETAVIQAAQATQDTRPPGHRDDSA